jgi:hypothetical protein
MSLGQRRSSLADGDVVLKSDSDPDQNLQRAAPLFSDIKN